MNQGNPSAPPGWHVQADGRERYWDGAQWTDQYRAAPTAATAHPVPAAVIACR